MSEILSCRDLSFGYHKGPLLIDSLSLDLEPHAMVAITGPSGRGKSTLLYLLGLMLTPRSGEIFIHGTAMSKVSDAGAANMRAKHLGFVFQDAALDATRSVLDNVTEVALYQGTARKFARERALGLLIKLGVDVPAHRKPGQVSGGQAQRIALARTLVTQPSIILADEPTGNLDDANAEVVISTLEEVAAQGGVVVVATHDPRMEARCTQVVRL